LKLIRDLQEEGFNLNGIKRLLDGEDGTAERMTRFKRALTSPYDEQPARLTLTELAERFRLSAAEAEAVLSQAENLKILVPDGDGGYEAPSPALLAVAEEVARQGISLQEALAVFEELVEHADAVAHAFVRLFVHDVWGPFQRADMPPERWPEIDESIERLRPLASDALLAIFQARMRSQIEAAFGDGAERVAAR
jgi:DNA-binding transcriptional MerR regulator